MKITLNLIPSREKDKLRQEKRLRMLARWALGLSVLLAIFILTLVSVDYILSINASLILEGRENGAEYKKTEEFQSEVKKMNATVSEAERMQKGQFYWTHLGEMMNRSVSDGVMLTSLVTKNYAVFLVGKAKTRVELMKLKEALDKEECVSKLNFPLSNLISKENVEFHIDFEIKKECLLNQ